MEQGYGVNGYPRVLKEEPLLEICDTCFPVLPSVPSLATRVAHAPLFLLLFVKKSCEFG